MADTTRIADLPDNRNLGGGTVAGGVNFGTAGYTPLNNIHPNPYLGGNQMNIPTPPAIGIPQQQTHSTRGMGAGLPLAGGDGYDRSSGGVGAGYISPDVMANFPSTLLPGQNPSIGDIQPQYKLPSRDIPREQVSYQQDEEIQANYIPKPKKNRDRDYIDDEENTDVHIRANNKQLTKQYEKSKKQKQLTEDVFGELQVPLFISFLYFLFSMPFLNTILYRYANFGLFHLDGNINYYGLMVKSLLFGIIFYSINRGIDFIGEL